jgi:hypothetical protein
MIGNRLGKWLPLIFSVLTALDGWLAFGSFAQSTLMAAAIVRRLTSKVGSVAGRAIDFASSPAAPPTLRRYVGVWTAKARRL